MSRRSISYWTVVTLVAAAACLYGMLGRWQKSPPEALPGSVPAFDRLLREAAAGRKFVFDERTRVVATGLDGDHHDEVLIDLRQFTGSPEATSVSHAALSPNRRQLLVPFRNRRWANLENTRLLVLDLSTGRAKEIAAPVLPDEPADPPQGKRALGFGPPWPHWLSDDRFVVALDRFSAEGNHQYHQKVLRYDLGQPDFPQEIDFGLLRPFFWVSPSGAFMVGDGRESTGSPAWPTLRVLGPDGLRPATAAERQAFTNWYRNGQPASPQGPQAVTLDRRLRGFWRPLFDDKGPLDWDIRFGGRLIRRSKYPVELRPGWEVELGLYLWSEWEWDQEGQNEPHIFVADPLGHYRWWHRGSYIGPIPALH